MNCQCANRGHGMEGCAGDGQPVNINGTLRPDGSMLGGTEMQALRELNDLCKRYGYGRIPQLARHVEKLWNAKLRRCGPGPWKPDPE